MNKQIKRVLSTLGIAVILTGCAATTNSTDTQNSDVVMQNFETVEPIKFFGKEYVNFEHLKDCKTALEETTQEMDRVAREAMDQGLYIDELEEKVAKLESENQRLEEIVKK